ncbi:MAG TPA: FAD-dependent oxidoreductase, partial [Gemmatimonadaceae bacterium]
SQIHQTARNGNIRSSGAGRLDMTDDPSLPNERHILVIGAGIAGLAAALRARSLDAQCRVSIVDAASRFGGKIDGEIVAGCVVDGAADVCIGAKLRATYLFAQLNFAARVIAVNPNGLGTFEKRDGELQLSATTFSDELLTFREGMRELTDATCAALSNVTAITDAPIESLVATESGWQALARNGAMHLADAVIVATPAAPAAQLLSTSIPSAGAALRAIEYPPTTTVTLGFHSADVEYPLDATGYLVADPAALVSAVTWTSAKNPSHADPQTVLLRGYVRETHCSPTNLVIAECASVLGIKAEPYFTREYRWPEGIAVYPTGHEEQLRLLDAELASTPGLFVAGSAFHGVGVPDCIASGERAATAAVSFVASLTSGVHA